MNNSERRLEAALVELMNALNAMGGDSEKAQVVREVFSRSHRTIQQGMMRTVIIPILQELNDNFDNNSYDLRNQASCYLAHNLLLSVDNVYLPFI